MWRTLKDRVVFITGGSRGIGRAIALRCARDGARVVVAGRNAASLDAAVAIGGDQGKNAEQKQPAIAVNEKLDPVVIAQNLCDLWFAGCVPRRCNNSSSPRPFQRGIAGCKIQNISRKDAMNAKVGGKRQRPSREYFSFPSELGAFAPRREEDPNPRILSVA